MKNEAIYAVHPKQGDKLPVPGTRFILADGNVAVVLEVKEGQLLAGWFMGAHDCDPPHKLACCIGSMPTCINALAINMSTLASRNSIVLVPKNDYRVVQEWSRLVKEGVVAREESQRRRVICEGDHPLDLE